MWKFVGSDPKKMDFRITIIVFCSSSLPLTPILHRYSCRSLPQPSHIQAKASGQSRSSRKSKQKVIADAFSPHTSYPVSKLDSFIGRVHCGPEMGNAISELNDLCAVVAFILFFFRYDILQWLVLVPSVHVLFWPGPLALTRNCTLSTSRAPTHTRAHTHFPPPMSAELFCDRILPAHNKCKCISMFSLGWMVYEYCSTG